MGEPKPGVDWATIEDRYRAGETATRIAKDYDISRQAIEQKARKNGWNNLIAAIHQTDTAKRIADPQNRHDKRLASFGKRTPQNLEAIVKKISQGYSPSVAARAIGISDATLSLWRKDDKKTDDIVTAAVAEYAGTRLQNIKKAGDRGDWKADAWFLARNKATRDEFGDTDKGSSGGITVVLNVPRATSAFEDALIDITPTNNDVSD